MKILVELNNITYILQYKDDEKFIMTEGNCFVFNINNKRYKIKITIEEMKNLCMSNLEGEMIINMRGYKVEKYE